MLLCGYLFPGLTSAQSIERNIKFVTDNILQRIPTNIQRESPRPRVGSKLKDTFQHYIIYIIISKPVIK